MESKHILIVSGGSEVSGELLRHYCELADYIIAADSGLKHLDRVQIMPNLIVGDFDSLRLEGWQERYKEVPVKGFMPEKDYTDTELALEEAMALMPETITMVNVTGTRLDHGLANMMLLGRAHAKGIKARIVDNHNHIEWLSEGTYQIEKEDWHFMSLVPISLEIEVSLTYFKYPLDHRKANRGDTLTISNEWLEEVKAGLIELHRGEVLLIRSRD